MQAISLRNRMAATWRRWHLRVDGDARMIGVRALPGRRARCSMRSAVLAASACRCRGAAQQGGGDRGRRGWRLESLAVRPHLRLTNMLPYANGTRIENGLLDTG